MEDISSLTALTTLLQQSSSNFIQDKASKRDNNTTKPDSRPTIFDLRKEDRSRILKLIEELLDAQDDVDKLTSKLEEQRTEYGEKRNILIKKLDRLSDKHEMTLSDIKNMKEKYSCNLKMLEEKISTVSDKFEVSMLEIAELKKTNAKLTEENALLKLECQTVASSFHEDVRKLKEKGYRRHLKKAMSVETKINLDERSAVECEKSSKHEESTPVIKSSLKVNTEKSRQNSGAGDFVTDRIPTPSGFETISTPAMVILDKNIQSVFIPASRTPQVTPRSIDVHRYPSFSFNNDPDDLAILENLFFRF